MLQISATEAWRTSHPGASIGLLELAGVENHGASPRLDERKRRVETDLRRRLQGFSRKYLLLRSVFSARNTYPSDPNARP